MYLKNSGFFDSFIWVNRRDWRSKIISLNKTITPTAARMNSIRKTRSKLLNPMSAYSTSLSLMTVSDSQGSSIRTQVSMKTNSDFQHLLNENKVPIFNEYFQCLFRPYLWLTTHRKLLNLIMFTLEIVSGVILTCQKKIIQIHGYSMDFRGYSLDFLNFLENLFLRNFIESIFWSSCNNFMLFSSV